MVRVLTIIVLLAALCGASLSVRLRDLDDRSLRDVTRYTKDLIKEAAGADRTAYVAANATYYNVASECRTRRDNEKAACSKCGLETCKSDMEARCQTRPDKPNFWEGIEMLMEEKVLAPVGEFFEDDVGNFIKDDIGGAFEDSVNWFADDFADFWADDFAGGAKDLANDVADWVEDDFAEFWADDFAGGVEDAANEVAEFFTDDIGDGVRNAAEEVGEWFADDFADFWEDDVGGAFKNVGKEIGGWFGGKRKRRSVGGAQPPSCDQLRTKESAAEACQYYKAISYCPTCTPPSCPELSEARNSRNQTKAEARRWITLSDGTALKYPGSGDYTVNSISYDPRAFDAQADGYTGVRVRSSLFGRTFTFTLEQAVDVYEPSSVAPIIFTKTLQAASA